MTDVDVPSPARLTLPRDLELKDRDDGEVGVFSKKDIPPGIQFGPFDSPRILTLDDLSCPLKKDLYVPLKIFSKDGPSLFLDTCSENLCNWMCLINWQKNSNEQNLIAYQLNDDIYYKTQRHIKIGDELIVGYSALYGKRIRAGLKEEYKNLSVESHEDNIKKDIIPLSPSLHENVTTGCKRKVELREENVITKRPTVISLQGNGTTHIKTIKTFSDIDVSTAVRCENSLNSVSSTLEESLSHTSSQESQTEFSTTDFSNPPDEFRNNEWKGKDLHIAVLNIESKEDLFSCDQKFSNKNCLTRHKHTEELACSQIESVLAHKQNLLKHFYSEPPEQIKCEQMQKTKIFNCDFCDLTFSKQNYLMRHARKHTGEFRCSQCERVFARKENLRKHLCSGSLEKIQEDSQHECPLCFKIFGTEKFLMRHMVKHTGEYTCDECGQSYSTKDTLLNHVCPEHPTNESYTCSVCNKKFSKQIYLTRHLPVHTGRYSCSICGKWLRSATSLTNHLKLCNQVPEMDQTGKTICTTCDQEFIDVAEFRRHQYEHTHFHTCEVCGAKFRNLITLNAHSCQGSSAVCDICGGSFTNIAAMILHQFSHEQINCSSCGKRFCSKSLYEKHVCEDVKASKVAKNAKISVPLICEVCGSCFSSYSSLCVHKKLHGEKTHACDICSKKFHRKDQLLEHYAVHWAPTIPCSFCEKLFKTKKALDVHVQTHDGVKRFQCSQCDKRFFQKCNLQKHEDTHNKELKYTCTLCEKSFTTKQYLKMHVHEHTNARVYECNICKRSYARPLLLKKHYNRIHGNQIYACKYCNVTMKFRHSLTRHLKKKHSLMEQEWNHTDVLNSMLMITKPLVATYELNDATIDEPDDVATNEQYDVATNDQYNGATNEQYNGVINEQYHGSSNEQYHGAINEQYETNQLQTSESAAVQDDEVVLTVSETDGQLLRNALASGHAHIRRGTLRNTIEITVPLSYAIENSIVMNSNVDNHSENSTLLLSNSSDLSTNFSEPETAISNNVLISANEQLFELKSSLNQHLDLNENHRILEDVSQEFESSLRTDEISINDTQEMQLNEGQHIILTQENFQDETHQLFLDTSIETISCVSNSELPEDAVVEEGSLQSETGSSEADILLYVMTAN